MPDKFASNGSVTGWLHSLRGGNEAAALDLWRRYFASMARLAQRRLYDHRDGGFDGEDVALSAFNGFCQAAQEGRYQVDDRYELWRLLARMTMRKASDRLRYLGAAKRGGSRQHPATQHNCVNQLEPDELPGPIDDPQMIVIMREECECLLDKLGDDELATLALHRLEGYSVDEISTRMGYSRRTVYRMLSIIRESWMSHAPPEPQTR